MAEKPLIILGIESSCDETSAAVLANGKILANVIATQKVHEQYGGVVPELASRAHQQNIVPVVDAAIKKAEINLNDIDGIAYTRGPGLIGALLVGASFAKGLALALNKPLIEVNHMQAHVLAHFIKESDEQRVPEFPFLCLTVSGGHTQIVFVKSPLEMEIIGETIDDAAGEAFDKAAKIMGLPYPGGPLIDKYAQLGDSTAFKFPKPVIPGLDFSFSGLKTSFLYFMQKELLKDKNFQEKYLHDICASLQHSIVSILMDKLLKASAEHNIFQLAIAGGVSANSGLRNELVKLSGDGLYKIFLPKFEFCTDNAGMIAMAGHFKFLRSEFSNQTNIPLARWHF